MPRERSDMRRVKELLRLAHELGYSKRQIAQSIRMPKTTVGDYLARATAAGLCYADVAGMSEEAVEALLFQRVELPEQRPMPDWQWVSAELGRRGVTLMLIWEEYRQQHRDGYSYSQFRRHFLNHTSASTEPRMRREHAPGAACEVDYAGMTLTISTAEGPRQASVFVGCLPFSGYLYAEATWTRTAEDWLASHVRLFSHLDGVVPKLVPDNLKTGITHASFYDPVVNRSYHELARHYGTGVVPARVRRPRDKAAAEKGVQIVETRVLAALRNRVFFTLDEANAAIRELVAAVNARPLTTNRTLTRCRLFEEQEKPLLMPLPAEPFVIGRWFRYKLAPDYHVCIEGVAYSVPYRLIGRHVDVFCTVSLVSIFHKGQRVAAHARQDAESGRATVTLDEHRPPNHRAAALLTPEAVRVEAAGLGGALGLLADRIFADADHPDQAARQVAGLLRLGRLHGTVALQAAATAALSANVRSYRFVQQLLARGRIEAVEDPAGGLGPHANLGGPAYYH
jgi:transposase